MNRKTVSGIMVTIVLANMLVTALTIGCASGIIVGNPPFSQIGNHTPPEFDTTSITFTLDATDADFGIAVGVYPPTLPNRYAISVWGFNTLFVGFYLFADVGSSYIEEDFQLISGSNVAGEIGTYELTADYNANNPLIHVDPSKGYYFRIVDQSGQVTFIGAGGQQFSSETDVQSNVILFGSETIGPCMHANYSFSRQNLKYCEPLVDKVLIKSKS